MICGHLRSKSSNSNKTHQLILGSLKNSDLKRSILKRQSFNIENCIKLYDLLALLEILYGRNQFLSFYHLIHVYNLKRAMLICTIYVPVLTDLELEVNLR